jgi:hypothetical protein
MKLKLNAAGDKKVDMKARVHFYAIYNGVEKGLFFYHKITVGKLTDLLAREFDCLQKRGELELVHDRVVLGNSFSLEELVSKGGLSNGGTIYLCDT